MIGSFIDYDGINFNFPPPPRRLRRPLTADDDYENGAGMHRAGSRFANHPRITWFGKGGSVAYVDYTGAVSSYFIGDDGRGTFKVIPADWSGDGADYTGFETFDAAVEFAIAAADVAKTAKPAGA